MTYLIKARLPSRDFVFLGTVKRLKGLEGENVRRVYVFWGRRTYLFLHPLSSYAEPGAPIAAGHSEAAD